MLLSMISKVGLAFATPSIKLDYKFATIRDALSIPDPKWCKVMSEYSSFLCDNKGPCAETITSGGAEGQNANAHASSVSISQPMKMCCLLIRIDERRCK